MSVTKENQYKQSLILHALPVVFYTTQPSGEFKLTYISPSVKKLTGFDESYFDKNAKFWESRLHPDDRDRAKKVVSDILKNHSYDLEYRWKCENGEYRWFYDHGELILDYQGKAREVAGSWINITDKKVTEQSINLLNEKTSSATGRVFFRTLVKNIAEILGINYVFISKCVNKEKSKARTLAFWEKDRYSDDMEYDLEGTPCKVAASGQFYYREDNILSLFPNVEELKKYKARGYLGIPIYDSRKSVIGHLAVFHDEPFGDISKYFPILRIFALRAGSEIERIEAETSLKRSHEKLEAAFNEIQILKRKLEEENISLKEEIKTEHNFDEIVGSSKSFAEVMEKAKMVAGTDANVLIRGETGTGKELIARLIHSSSDRSENPLIKVNCPAIPAGLIESELFGHEKGAFTGALTRKTGKFELADGGTLFLDELGDLSLDAQAKLLRVLQEREFERVGGNETYKVDVRVIAATNRNLEEAVSKGKFRADLFYRLNVFPIELPSLIERVEDISDLANYFLNKYSRKFGKAIKGINRESVQKLENYSWPGNIRELENIIERAVIFCNDDTLKISENLLSSSAPVIDSETNSPRLEDVERKHILKVLNRTNWQIHGKKGAANILDMNPSTLRTRLNKLGIKKKIVSEN